MYCVHTCASQEQAVKKDQCCWLANLPNTDADHDTTNPTLQTPKTFLPYLEQQVVEKVVLISHDRSRLEDGGGREGGPQGCITSCLAPQAAGGVVG